MANPFQGDDVDPFSAVRDEEGNIQSDSKTGGVGEPMKMASFKEAFKEARNRGDKTFEYMGKKYTTDMAGGRRASAPAARDTSARSASTPRATNYGEAARSSRTLGDLMSESTQSREDLREAVRSGKEKTLGTKLQEFGGRFKRALMTGRPQGGEGMKKGGKVKKYASGGSVSSASKRADGCAQRGKTKGRMV
jgi:hypothetical protein